MNKKVFIIAELSANHNGSKEIAFETIKAAKRSGADAIKLQTYTADTLTLNSRKDDFIIKGGTIWDGTSLHELYSKAFTPWEWHKDLFICARNEGLICFSSPFDKTAVDFLESFEVPYYKIASFEITDISLIRYTASKGKPMILSTGVATFEDIALAIETCREAGNNDITILKCTSSYPAPIEEANMLMMQKFAQDFGVKVGLSDHTLGITLPIVAVALGATVIEKHFILNKSIGGPDASFSLDENEFKLMVDCVREAEKSLGVIDYKLTEKQITGKQFTRSLYISKNVKKGDLISNNNVKSVRPGYGLHPKYLLDVLGKKFNGNYEKGDRLNFKKIFN